jgi:hypothetical protein
VHDCHLDLILEIHELADRLRADYGSTSTISTTTLSR